MCYDTLKAMSESPGGKANPQKKPPAITKEPKYKELMMGFEGLDPFPPHPKMDKLKSLVLEHLLTKDATGDDRGPAEPNPNTRIMVFVTYRECVEEVVDYLNLESPIIKATKFVGQGTDKGGRKGFAQKEQLNVSSLIFLFAPALEIDRDPKVIQKFKAGEFNLLVSTSIGEEGLDIGEIDLIVCYDAQKTPIRMVRRIIAGVFVTLTEFSFNGSDVQDGNVTAMCTFCSLRAGKKQTGTRRSRNIKKSNMS